jgi:DNA-3-methyladenine glycosylase II
LDQKILSRLDHNQRSEQLTEIWGVGQWTADMMGIFYFGDKDVWPDSDLAVWKTLQRLTNRRRKTLRTAQRFAPHRSYLAIYMWRIADTMPN